MKKVDAITLDCMGFLHLQKGNVCWTQKCPFAGGNVVCGTWCIHFGEIRKNDASGLAPVHMLPDPGPDYAWKLDLTCGCGVTIVAKTTLVDDGKGGAK